MSATANLGDLVDFRRDLAKVAVIDLLDPADPRYITYGQLDAMASAVARGLVRRGLDRGDRVGILARNRSEYLASYFGILRAGMTAVLVNARFTRDTVAFVAGDAQLRLLLTDGAGAALCPEGVPTVSFDDDSRDGFPGLLDAGPFRTLPMSASDIGMILYTSGSTGRPKGVPLTHAGQLWTLSARGRGVERPDEQRLIVAAPLCHMNGLLATLFTIYTHASVVMLAEFDAPAYLRGIGAHRVTWLTGVPTMMALILQQRESLPDIDLSSVLTVAMGSAPASPRLFARLKALFPGARVVNGYGTTESGAIAFGPHPDGLPRPEGSLGHPLTDIEYRLEGEGDEGLLYLKTPAVMPGYLNLPEKTREVLDAHGWYMTGDVMRRDANGFFFFLRRHDDMFVCGGENIVPDEVERLLEQHPDIEQACVVPVADEIKGQKPVAFVVARPHSKPTEAEVKRFALENAAAVMHPRAVYFLDRMPMAGTHKIDRKALREQAESLRASGERHGPADSPSTEHQRRSPT